MKSILLPNPLAYFDGFVILDWDAFANFTAVKHDRVKGKLVCLVDKRYMLVCRQFVIKLMYLF
jgi:hypothetical protein